MSTDDAVGVPLFNRRVPAATIVGRDRVVKLDSDPQSILVLRIAESRTRADEEYVHRAFEELSAQCEGVVGVVLQSKADLRRLPDLSPMSLRLKLLEVDSPDVQDWSGAEKLVALREASLNHFSEPTSSIFSACPSLNSFRLESPARAFRRLSLSANVVWVRGARHAIDVGDLRASCLCLESSGHMRLADLSQVNGLRAVDLRAMRSLAEQGFTFLDGCRGVQEVLALGVSLSSLDFGPLVRSDVTNAYLQVSDTVVHSLAERWPQNGVLTNGRVGFTQGRQGPGDSLWERRSRVAPSIHDSAGLGLL